MREDICLCVVIMRCCVMPSMEAFYKNNKNKVRFAGGRPSLDVART